MKIEITNLGDIIDRLNELSELDIKKGLTESALMVENEAKLNAPVASGTLRNSITHSVDETEATIGTNLEYAPYVEYGTGLFSSLGNGRTDVPWKYQDASGKWHSTSGQKPQPFLMPAWDATRDDVIEVFEDLIKEATK